MCVFMFQLVESPWSLMVLVILFKIWVSGALINVYYVLKQVATS